MSRRIHVLINGEQFGPYPENEFRQHVADRKILRGDLVWREGLTDWIPAGELLSQLETPTAIPTGQPVAHPSGQPVDQPAAARSPAPGTQRALEAIRLAAVAGDPAEQFRFG